MQVNGTQLNPAATNLYSAVEIKKPADAGQTPSSGGVESELEVEDVFRISSEIDQDGAGSADPDAPEKQKKKVNAEREPAAEPEPPEDSTPEDPMSIWG